jgi:hypothetical protein
VKKGMKKIKDDCVKFYDLIKNIKNDFAREFFVTYFSGETKKSYDPTTMFHYFVLFIREHFGIDIADSNDNLKEFN